MTADTQNQLDDKQSSALEAFFEAGAHVGYTRARRHPKMKKFIFGNRNNVEIIDLEKTASSLEAACDFLKTLGKAGKNVLWVGTKPAAASFVEAAAVELGMPYVTDRWLGGTLTNFKVMEGRLQYWQKLEQAKELGEFEKYVKKEQVTKNNELRKLTRIFGGLRKLTSMPAAMVVVDPLDQKTAVAEARSKKVPVVAILNIDSNPDGIHYPIPANDNASATVALITNRLKEAYLAGLKEKETV